MAEVAQAVAVALITVSNSSATPIRKIGLTVLIAATQLFYSLSGV